MRLHGVESHTYCKYIVKHMVIYNVKLGWKEIQKCLYKIIVFLKMVVGSSKIKD